MRIIVHVDLDVRIGFVSDPANLHGVLLGSDLRPLLKLFPSLNNPPVPSSCDYLSSSSSCLFSLDSSALSY